MSDVKALKALASNISLLYVEDNASLRKNASTLLKKFFDNLDVAEDGQKALELFKKHHYPLVVTDIKMPHMDGLSLSQHIKKISPQTKIIIMSAFDDKEYLFKGIELGVFRFLQKPVSVSELSTVLKEAIEQINDEKNSTLFYSYLQTVFNYQSSLVVMLDDDAILFANDTFLRFFACESVDECKKNLPHLSAMFLQHANFLYDRGSTNALDTIFSNANHLYHVQMKDPQENIRHFILKYQRIPEKENYGVLSFDDITEMGIDKAFDKEDEVSDIHQCEALFDLLHVIQRNSAKLELHNYYKGLSITNSGEIIEIKEQSISIKTNYMQLRAMQIENKLLLASSALPYVVECSSINKISFESQIVEVSSLHFVKTSAIDRSNIRVKPSEKQSVSLFIEGRKFLVDASIDDISLDAVKIDFSALPAGIVTGSKVIVDLVLELDKKPLIIHSDAQVLKKDEKRRSFSVVFMFENAKKSDLIKYISKRQMQLIREIKGIQNG